MLSTNLTNSVNLILENQQKRLCSACEIHSTVPQETPETENTIWGFYPYTYSSYHELKNAFNEFIESKPNKEDKSFYSIHNEDGYTYSQWYIYFLSKNTYKCKKCYQPTLWLLNVLSKYSFFLSLLEMGTRDDPKHHTLHHFVKYIDRYGYFQKKTLNFLLTFTTLKMTDKDSDGMSAELYLSMKEISKDDLDTANRLTHLYKEYEKLLLNYTSILPFITKCERCGDDVSVYEDLEKINNDTLKQYHELLDKICGLREECNNIYIKATNVNYNDSVERHRYVIDIYKRILQRIL